jgi:hypothetical protein
VWLIAFAVSLGVLWAIGNPFFLCHPNWQLFLREIGFALLIASIFGSTIELVQRQEFIRLVTQERDELKRDVFLYAYGFSLPDQIREEIRNSVLNSNFYRKDLTLDWEFSLPADGLTVLKKRFSYTLVNNSSESSEWDFKFNQIGTDDCMAVEESIFHVLKVTREDGKITKYGPADMKEERPADLPHVRTFRKPIGVSGREEVAILCEITQKRKLSGDDQFSLREMAVGTTLIKLRFPEGTEFEVTVSCKQKQLRRAPDEDPPRIYSFEFREGLFPHQAIAISWSQKAQLNLGVGVDAAH